MTADLPPARPARFTLAVLSILRRLAAVYLLIGVVCLVFLGSCCATNRLWRAVDDAPTWLLDSRVDGAGVLHAAVEYEDGDVWLLTADLGPPSAEWRGADAVRTGPFDGALPSGDHVPVSYRWQVDKSADEDHSLWVDGSGYHVVVTCPAPVDWGGPGPYLAILATPVTLAVDLVTAPVHVLWIFMTAGGHGDPWLPWCGD